MTDARNALTSAIARQLVAYYDSMVAKGCEPEVMVVAMCLAAGETASRLVGTHGAIAIFRDAAAMAELVVADRPAGAVLN